MVEQPRGTVTFLFSDIEGSTRLLQELGREAYARALDEHRRLLRDAFAQHDGYEVDCEGDAFFVAFQAAGEAIAAAAEAQEALATGRVRVRIGLHTGEPLLAPPKYVGLEVHKAARVMAAAHGGQVLLSQATRELVETDVADLGLHRLKDLPEPLRLFQLGHREFPPPTTLSPLSLPVRPLRSQLVTHEILGRETELATLAGFFDTESPPAVLVLEGAAGMGKTTLWSAGIELAVEHSLPVLACQPSEAETAFSFAALGDLLGPVLDQTIMEIPLPQRRALEAALLPDDSGAHSPDLRMVALGLLSLVRVLGKQRPLLLAIDDAQWLDQASAAALEFALRRLSDERLLVLLSIRRASDGETLAIERATGEGLTYLRVGPLTITAVRRLLTSRLAQSLSRPLLTRVHELAGGNPFYALELARSLRERGETGPGDGVPIPPALDQLVRARLERLPREVIELLERAALLAQPTLAILSAVDREPDTLGERIDHALAEGVIELEGGRIRFAHPLLASAAVARIGPNRRRRLHAQLAAIVLDPEEQARHLARSTDTPDAKVADLLDAGARHAARRAATTVAAELFELAAQRTPATDRPSHSRRVIEAAELHLTSGDLGRARALLEPLIEQLPRGALRADALHLLASIRYFDDLSAARKLTEQALREAQGDGVRARILCSLARLELHQAAPAAAQRAREALEAAERSGDEQLTRIMASYVLCWETFAGERTPGLLERLLTYVADEQADGDYLGRRMEGVTAGGVAMTLLCLDRFDEARELWEFCARAYRNLEDWGELVETLVHQTELECITGNWSAAAAFATEGLELMEQLGIETGGAAALYAHAWIEALRGNVQQARETAERGVAIGAANRDQVFAIQNRRVLGFLELSLGDVRRALTYLEPVSRWIMEGSWGIPSILDTLPNAAEAMIAVSELDAAQSLISNLERWGNTMNSPWARAAAARCEGLLCAARGDLSHSFEAYGHALREHELLQTPFERGRTLLALGMTQLEAKRHPAARESLEAALSIFLALDARLWVAKARNELAKVTSPVAVGAGTGS